MLAMDSSPNIPKPSEVRDIRGQSITLRRMALADTDALWQAASTHARGIFRWYTHPIDTYDAMTSDRPYRKGMDPKIAFAEIKSLVGKHYDARVVECFEEVLKEDGLL